MPHALILPALLSVGCLGSSVETSFGDGPCTQLDGDLGLERCPIEVDDDEAPERSYLVHRPATVGPETPVVVALHGVMGDAEAAADYMDLLSHADEAQALAIFPEGKGKPVHWNAGGCCNYFLQPTLDDTSYVLAVIDEVMTAHDLSGRVYLVGFSNGAMLAHKLACEHSDRFSAVATVSGTMAVQCAPSQPVPILQIHGDEDGIVSIDGSRALGFSSFADSVAFWRAANGCNDTYRYGQETGEVSCEVDPYCVDRSEVVACTITGGGHAWPGAGEDFTTGYSTADISSAEVWEFLTRF